MYLPPIDAAALKPYTPSLDYGIDIEPKRNPMREHNLTQEECVARFGALEAVTMNFVPQMLTALALEQCSEFIAYCRDHRLTEFKKHNREMRKCMAEYERQLRDSYGSAYPSYEHYYARVKECVELDLFKCWCTFTNAAARQYIGYVHKDIPARVCFIRMILTFVEDFDKRVDRMVAERLDTPCYRKQDPFCFLISALCMDIAETIGKKMEITETMALCVRVLATRCHSLAATIIKEESEQSGNVSKC